MLDVIDLFREHETRDELGIGSVRDGFADLLFPGTSTIMTRARYFLIIPWVYQRLETRRVPSAEVAAKARSAELDLIEVIGRSGDHDGQIGKRAKRRLKRLPSSVYWQGLGVWGIRTYPGDQAQYHRTLDRYYSLLVQQRSRTVDRDTEHDDFVSPNWHGGLVPFEREFPQKCSLKLSRREARYLSERIRLSPGCANTLLAELAGRRWRVEPIVFPWQHPQAAELHPELQEQLLHARNFSEAMHGPMLLYNLILAEQTHRHDAADLFKAEFKDWSDTLESRAHTFAQWNRQRFWELALRGNPRISGGARDFVNAWLDLVLNSGDVKRLNRTPAARDLIRQRERRLKKSLSRIDNPRASELWNGASGTQQIDFRWGVTQRILNDIFNGLELADA